MTNNGSLAAAFGAAPNLMLMRSESSSCTDALVAMFAASCSPAHMAAQQHHLQASRSTGSLEDAVMGCGGGGLKRGASSSFLYDPSAFGASLEYEGAAGEEDLIYGGGDIDCINQNGMSSVEKKRRLSFDQVRSLERNFGLENKLEPERKLQLAKELGLQPRQVAVWFQNRRARCKTKQLERDYEVLMLDYNRLKTEFELAIEEKKELKAKVQWLTSGSKAQLQEVEESAAGCVEAAGDDVSCKVVMASTTSVHAGLGAWPPHQGASSASCNNNPASLVLKPEKLQLEYFSNSCCNTRDVENQNNIQLQNTPASRSSTFLTAVESPSTTTRNLRKPDGDSSPVPITTATTTTSSASTSSEILDADSPRTIDSGQNIIHHHHKLPVPVAAAAAAESAALLDAANALVMNLSEDIHHVYNNNYGSRHVINFSSAQGPSYPVRMSTAATVNNLLKDECQATAAAAATCSFQENNMQDSSCNYLSSNSQALEPECHIAAAGALPWWDWPFANI